MRCNPFSSTSAPTKAPLTLVAAGIWLATAAPAGMAADTTAPTIPSGLTAQLMSGNQAQLKWKPAWDAVGVAGYAVYINSALYTKTTGTSYVVPSLAAGKTYRFQVAAYDAVANKSSWSAPAAVTVGGSSTTSSGGSTTTGTRTFTCSFNSSPRECGFYEQAKVAGRATLTSTARDGSTAVLLRTMPGDNNIAGSGSYERNDLTLSQGATGCSQGVTQWWGHSVRFPSDYVIPPSGSTWHWGIIFDFHHTGPTGQANLQIVSTPTGMVFWVAGGTRVVTGPSDPGHHAAPIGRIVKNTWYDFVYNVKWSSGTDGFIKAWVNGVKKMDYKGPTLYAGQGCYLKLANYHTPVGAPVSVIHDRVVRGTSASAVSTRTLQ